MPAGQDRVSGPGLPSRSPVPVSGPGPGPLRVRSGSGGSSHPDTSPYTSGMPRTICTWGPPRTIDADRTNRPAGLSSSDAIVLGDDDPPPEDSAGTRGSPAAGDPPGDFPGGTPSGRETALPPISAKAQGKRKARPDHPTDSDAADWVPSNGEVGGAQNATPTDDPDDDEVEFVSQKGPRPLSDFPHSRHDCQTCLYSSAADQTQNEAHCPNCYCYVCDDEARFCPAWKFHCHAHPNEPEFRALRRLAQHTAHWDSLDLRDWMEGAYSCSVVLEILCSAWRLFLLPSPVKLGQGGQINRWVLSHVLPAAADSRRTSWHTLASAHRMIMLSMLGIDYVARKPFVRDSVLHIDSGRVFDVLYAMARNNSYGYELAAYGINELVTHTYQLASYAANKAIPKPFFIKGQIPESRDGDSNGLLREWVAVEQSRHLQKSLRGSEKTPEAPKPYYDIQWAKAIRSESNMRYRRTGTVTVNPQSRLPGADSDKVPFVVVASSATHTPPLKLSDCVLCVCHSNWVGCRDIVRLGDTILALAQATDEANARAVAPPIAAPPIAAPPIAAPPIAAPPIAAPPTAAPPTAAPPIAAPPTAAPPRPGVDLLAQCSVSKVVPYGAQPVPWHHLAVDIKHNQTSDSSCVLSTLRYVSFALWEGHVGDDSVIYVELAGRTAPPTETLVPRKMMRTDKDTPFVGRIGPLDVRRYVRATLDAKALNTLGLWSYVETHLRVPTAFLRERLLLISIPVSCPTQRTESLCRELRLHPVMVLTKKVVDTDDPLWDVDRRGPTATAGASKGSGKVRKLAIPLVEPVLAYAQPAVVVLLSDGGHLESVLGVLNAASGTGHPGVWFVGKYRD